MKKQNQDLPIDILNETNMNVNQKENVVTILVAEDEDFNYFLIEELLIDNNYQLIHAKNGKEAVEQCQLNTNIDLVLMDIRMPLLDGHTAARQIKLFLPNLPIIAQSAYALDHEVQQYSLVFDDYITKPIIEKVLKEKISKFL